MAHTLLVMPDDTAQPILGVEAIRGAKKSIRVKMFLFSHPETQMLDAVIEAKRRGVSVRVMLNPTRRSAEIWRKTKRHK